MHWIDVSIMAAYMIGITIIGVLSRGKGEDAEDYFVAGGSQHSWFESVLVGLSIAATFFSGISFIAYPSVVYSNGVLLPVWGVLVCLPIQYTILRYWFLPRYLAGGWAFPYQVIESRFGPAARTFAAGLYVLMRIGWMAAMIYAPTLAIITMGRLDQRWFWPIVLITGLSNTLYTVVSGVRGVIVTEALHIPVIAFGVAATIISAWWQMPVPVGEALADVARQGRFDVLNFSIDPTSPLTVWTVLLGVSLGNLANYIGDPMSLQRYLMIGDARVAARSFAVNIIGVVIVVSLLSTVGLSMFAFYSHTADPTLPSKPDQVFPHFVATRLPPGVAGLLLAALLAATGIPSGINALASVLTIDFHTRFLPSTTPTQALWWGRVYSLLLGALATVTAGFLSKLGTIFEMSQVILGVFAGPLLTCVAVAVAGWRCTGPAMIAGMLTGWATGVAVSLSGAAPSWAAPSSSLATLASALIFTHLAPRATRSSRFEACVPPNESVATDPLGPAS
ncbi:sodium:solute symporter family transporter [Paludisphaera rhizosphaerae]|uniref:sodium:solute symporter family transporter n=1 Tax=Paludisphaera rhizosphaerae TaxID=2711216 RepID=UPI0013EBAB55|nr:hypothetical protein [Paludisphaera rhizosphaerae]